MAAAKQRLETYNGEIAAANAELAKPFEHAQKVIELTLELEKINAELNLDQKETELVIDDTKFQNEVKTETGGEDESDDDGDGRQMPPVIFSARETDRQNDYELG